MGTERTVNILLVDDRPEQRLALTAVLGDLGGNVVQAASGREALRALLAHEFAVILLDINMPGMDGFETATLIRQRPSSEHTPIIFITAHSDDAHAMRGYSLGAVDYILAPVDPQVLRTKVAVFIELFKKTEEVRQQAESLRQRAAQLQKLTEASLAINSAQAIDGLLQVVANTAAEIIGVDQAVIMTTAHADGASPESLVAVSGAGWNGSGSHIDVRIDPSMLLFENGNQVVRLSATELERHPAREALQALGVNGGLLAVPLTANDGHCFGIIQLSDKETGDFTDDDALVLVQLAQVASIAIENAVTSQAREANRLKDEFLATLSHELRTPLQAMLSWTKLLRSNKLDAAAAARALEVIERSAKAQAQLIEDLLDVSRIMSGKLRMEFHPLDLRAVLEAALDAARPAASAKEIEIRARLDAPPCLISGDPARLQQVIANVLSNAVKFTPNGGTIAVALERDARQMCLRVTDTGIGIAPEFLPYIFERFRQGDSRITRLHSGLGLGLAIARSLVEQHGGVIEAHSAGPGQGSTFSVTLPLLVEAPRAQTPPERAEPASNGNGSPAVPRLDGVRVMIVEDEKDARESLTTFLEHCGAAVTAVSSAADALAALDHSAPDVLLSDVGMPGEDGYSLIRAVRARLAERGIEVPAAALTAYVRAEDRARALQAGFDAHIAKPVEPDELATVVHGLVTRSKRRDGERVPSPDTGAPFPG